MEIAKAKKCDVLIATDFSGNIVMLNLSLLKLNPLQVSIDATFSGYHDNEEPAILSLAYHDASGVIFSGGDDHSIRYWRLPKDIDFRTEKQHAGAVCCLSTTQHVLISGDEEGIVNVWTINTVLPENINVSGSLGKAEASDPLSFGEMQYITHSHGDSYTSRRSVLPNVSLVGSWNFGAYAAIRSVSAEEACGGVFVSIVTRLNKISVHFLNFTQKIFVEDGVAEGLKFSTVVNFKGISSSGGKDGQSSVKSTPDLCVDESENFNHGFLPTNCFSYVQCLDIDQFQSSAPGKEPTLVKVQWEEKENACFTYVGTENGSVYKYKSVSPDRSYIQST